MYIKVFQSILDASIANDRRLRHFFTDLMLCADADGNVVATKKAIANRIGADLGEVEWGLTELMKPDPESLSKDHEGKRVIPIPEQGYGWHIVNFAYYRDLKNMAEKRALNAARVRKHRLLKKVGRTNRLPGETSYLSASESGATEETLDSIVSGSLPEGKV